MLNLDDLDTDDIPGITRERCVVLAQAGAVCLDSQNHRQGVELTARGFVDRVYRVFWTPVTAQSSRAWNDADETTENGAAGIAILLAKREVGYTVILRSRRGTGFDYWLGDRGEGGASQAERAATEDLRGQLIDAGLVARARMEVSGIRSGDDRQIRERARRKLMQTKKSDDLGLPVYVVVVEFSGPIAEIEERR